MGDRDSQRWKNRLAKWLSVTGSLLLVCLASFLLLTSRSTHHRLFDLANHALLEGDYAACAEVFARLSLSDWVGGRARIGAGICRCLAGEAYELPAQDRDSISERELFPLRELLHRALTGENYDGCLNLARFSIPLGFQEAPLYEAAALLELGRRRESQEAYNSLDSRLQHSPLGTRLERVLTALAEDARSVLQDRRGRPIGWVTADRKVRLLEGVDPELVPVETIQQALAEKPASSVRLSIDLELSRLAKRALRGYRGSIVLLEPYTGEILAAVSDRYTRRRLADPAFHELLEPASISKLITTTAAMRADLDPDHEISRMRCNGALRLEGDYLWCPTPGGRLKGLNQAMGSSCNVAFATLGLMVGPSRLLDELHLYGFDSPERQGLQLGRILDQPQMKKETADLAIGLEHIACTPLHAALIAAVYANSGYRVEPTLFSARDGLLGISRRVSTVPERVRILDPEWLQPLRRSMEAVVDWGGTAHGIVPDGFPVAMKTGTAATPGRGYHTNYIGYGPKENPEVAFCIRITRIRSSRIAGQASRGATGRLLRYLAVNRELLDLQSDQENLQWTAAFEKLDD